MSIIDNSPEQVRQPTFFIDLGNSNVRFIRTYLVDLEVGIESFIDTDYEGNSYSVTGPVTLDTNAGDHGILEGLTDDDHVQYLNSTRHSAITGNPHNLTATDLSLGNVNNTSDANKPVSVPQQNAINLSIIQHEAASDPHPQYITAAEASVFGTEFEDFSDLSNVNITTSTFITAKSFTVASKPTGRYRIGLNVHLKPGATSNNYLLQLRVDGSQIGLEVEVEGKDSNTDIRVPEYFVAYYDHVGPGTFDIELAAAREGGTMIIHGVEAEVWRVS